MHYSFSAEKKPWDNPETSSAVCVSGALLCGVRYMKHHTALQLLDILLPLQLSLHHAQIFGEQQIFLSFLFSNP